MVPRARTRKPAPAAPARNGRGQEDAGAGGDGWMYSVLDGSWWRGDTEIGVCVCFVQPVTSNQSAPPCSVLDGSWWRGDTEIGVFVFAQRMIGAALLLIFDVLEMSSKKSATCREVFAI